MTARCPRALPRLALSRLATAFVVTLGVMTAVPLAASAAGTATVSGTITDTAGRPVEDVSIFPRIPQDVPQPTTTASTTASGTYSVKVPADTPVQVCATASGRLPTCFDTGRGFVIDRTPASAPRNGVGTRLTVAAGATRSGTDFQVPVPARFHGLLTDTAGRPVAGVRVRAHTDDVRGNDDEASAVSNSQGRYDLALPGQLGSPADYCLDVAAAGDDGYARLQRYRTEQSPGVYAGCDRLVSAGAVLTDNVTLTPDGTNAVANVATPYFVGTPKVGYTLSARAGRWDAAAPTVTYAWFDGVRRLGAGRSYVVRPAELGHAITIVATATVPGRAAGTRSWTKADRVVRGTFWIKHRPRVTGQRKVGHTLRARTSVAAPHGRRTYRWLRNGKPIRGATSSRYHVNKADRHKRLSVRVRYTSAGYTSTSRTSGRTHRVRG
jgi:hypothetical protein